MADGGWRVAGGGWWTVGGVEGHARACLRTCKSRVCATSCVKEKSITTKMSIKIVTASTTVVNGPLAFSSEMMAMAEEGDL